MALGPSEELVKGFWFCRESGAESRRSQQPRVPVIAEFRFSCEGFLGKAQTLLVLGVLIRAQRDKATTTATGASTGPGGCMLRLEAPALEALFLRSSFPNNRSVLLPGFLLWLLAHFLYILNEKMTPWNFERRHPEFEFPNTDFLWTFAHSEKPRGKDTALNQAWAFVSKKLSDFNKVT